MAKKVNIYLQAPLSTSDSLYYKNLLTFPPKNVQYKTNINSSGIITSKRKFFLNSFFKNKARYILEKINYPILSLHKTPVNNTEIIHCAHCLPKTEKKWVADFEAPWQFFISGRDTKLGKKKFLDIVSKKNCKYLLAWTETAKTEMIDKFPSIKDKVKVLNYAMPFKNIEKRRGRRVTLLFSARYFYPKGGLTALKVMDKLTKKYDNVEAIFISNVPLDIKKRYELNTKIKFFDLIPQKILFQEIYPKTDIFIYPGYSDTFGFGFIEAMNFGIPIVTVDGYARKEIVKQGKTGFVIENRGLSWNGKIPMLKEEDKIIEELVEKASLLIENKKLLEKMSKNCLQEVKTGKYSLKKRNEELGKIYRKTLN